MKQIKLEEISWEKVFFYLFFQDKFSLYLGKRMYSVGRMSIRKGNGIMINIVCVCNKKYLLKRTNYDTVWKKLTEESQ